MRVETSKTLRSMRSSAEEDGQATASVPQQWQQVLASLQGSTLLSTSSLLTMQRTSSGVAHQLLILMRLAGRPAGNSTAPSGNGRKAQGPTAWAVSRPG